MTRISQIQVIKLLKIYGYLLVRINRDQFNRLNGILKDRQGKRYFFKVVNDQDVYSFNSLFNEANVSRYLGKLSHQKIVSFKGYRLKIPLVKKIIKKDGIVCLISNLVEGNSLLTKPSQFQARILEITLEQLLLLNRLFVRSPVDQYLIKYTKNDLLLSLPRKLIKAVLTSPSDAVSLIKIALNFLKSIAFTGYHNALIHADLNASNIILKGKTIYLTDWEEVGWGISTYNIVGPLCVHWQTRVIRNKIFMYLQKTKQNTLAVPLLAHKVLILFNQKMDRSHPKRVRDLKLLRYLIKTRSL